MDTKKSLLKFIDMDQYHITTTQYSKDLSITTDAQGNVLQKIAGKYRDEFEWENGRMVSSRNTYDGVLYFEEKFIRDETGKLISYENSKGSKVTYHSREVIVSLEDIAKSIGCDVKDLRIKN